MTKLEFGLEVKKIKALLAAEMPALSFTVWDLKPFIVQLHNWRRNIIFIECDRVAVGTLVEKLGVVFRNYSIYSGIKKPVMGLEMTESVGSIVIVGREKSEVKSGTTPSIEKMLVDLLHYAHGGILPISLKDVVGLWEYYLEFHDETGLKFNELYRYATRRYLGWFVSIMAYKLSQKVNLGVDKRHILRGKRNLEMIRMVDSPE